MKFSFWNQYFSHSYESELERAQILENLESFYQKRNPKSVTRTDDGLTVVKGSLFMSLVAIGPETWLKNISTIRLVEREAHRTRVEFCVNLKLPGLTLGKNYLIEEMKQACEHI